MQGGPESPKHSEQLREPEAGERREVTPFGADLRALRRIAGVPLGPIPENKTDRELAEMELELRRGLRFRTFHEQFRSNELIHTYNALQRQKELEEGKPVNMPEFVVVNRARTYHEYFPIVLEHVMRLMEEYEELRASIPSVPEAIHQEEGRARLYVRALERAVRERVSFANVLLIDGLLAKHFFAEGEETQDTMHLRESYREGLNTPDTQESFAVLERRATQEVWDRGNALNQRIIDILAGKGGIEGVPDGFFPQQLLLDLLAHRYTEIIGEQQHLARDPNLADVRDRFEELLRRNDLARQGRGKPLSEEEGEEYRKLRTLIHGSVPGFMEKSERRRELMHRLVAVTGELGEYHLRMEELMAIQHHFGQHFDTIGALPSQPDQTPENIREAVARNMEERQRFHLDRVEAFLSSFESNVLNVDASVLGEDLWNEKGGRDFVVYLNERLSDLITIPLPENLGVREWARNRLKGPLKEALGWPPDKMDVPFDELPQKDRDRIEERAKSVLSAIREYNRQPMEDLHASLDALRLLNAEYPSSRFVGEAVREPLPIPDQPITSGNVQVMVDQFGAPTVYVLLFEQCQRDWGGVDPPSGFMGEQAKLFEKFNRNIDVHLDVGSALHELGRTWEKLMYIFLAGAGAGLAAGALLFTRTGRKILMTPPRAAKSVATRAARGALNRLKGGIRPVPTTPEAAPGRMGRLGKAFGSRGFGRALFFAAEIITAAELARRLNIQSHMKPLPEQEGVDAALEFMRLLQVDRGGERYEREVQSLIDRHELIAMRDVIDAEIARLKRGGEKGETIRGHIASGKALRARIEEENRDLYWVFPITGVFRVSSVRPDHVFFLYNELNARRRMGEQEEKRPRGKLRDLLNFLGRRKSPADIPRLQDVQPLKFPEGEEGEELRRSVLALVREFDEHIEEIRRVGPYDTHAKTVAGLGEEYEAWLKEVAAQR